MSGSPQSATTVSDEELARAHLYRLLGRLLMAPPDRQVLELLSSVGQQVDEGTPMAAAWNQVRAAGSNQTSCTPTTDPAT